jgi:hypothetical protein
MSQVIPNPVEIFHRESLPQIIQNNAAGTFQQTLRWLTYHPSVREAFLFIADTSDM